MASAPEAVAVTLPELVIVKGLSVVAKTSFPLIALLIVRAIDVAPSQPAEPKQTRRRSMKMNSSALPNFEAFGRPRSVTRHHPSLTVVADICERDHCAVAEKTSLPAAPQHEASGATERSD